MGTVASAIHAFDCITEGVDADLRRHDGVAGPRVEVDAGLSQPRLLRCKLPSVSTGQLPRYYRFAMVDPSNCAR